MARRLNHAGYGAWVTRSLCVNYYHDHNA